MDEAEKKITRSTTSPSSPHTVSVCCQLHISWLHEIAVNIGVTFHHVHNFVVGKEKVGRLMCLVQAAGLIDDAIMLLPDGKTHLWIDA